MPALRNPVHESMCRDVAGGMSREAAWRAHGFGSRNSTRFFKRPAIAKRVDELRAEFNEAAGIHLRYLQEKLLGIVTTDATEFFEQRPYSTSLRLRDPKTLPPEMRASVAEMYVDKGGRAGIKLESKLHALDSLLKTIGAFSDGATVNVAAIASMDVEITDDDRKKALASLFAKFKAKAEAVPLVQSDKPAQTRQANETAAPVKEIVEEKVVDYNNYRYEL
jgi:Terminase small subunit